MISVEERDNEDNNHEVIFVDSGHSLSGWPS